MLVDAYGEGGVGLKRVGLFGGWVLVGRLGRAVGARRLDGTLGPPFAVRGYEIVEEFVRVVEEVKLEADGPRVLDDLRPFGMLRGVDAEAVRGVLVRLETVEEAVVGLPIGKVVGVRSRRDLPVAGSVGGGAMAGCVFRRWGDVGFFEPRVRVEVEVGFPGSGIEILRVDVAGSVDTCIRNLVEVGLVGLDRRLHGGIEGRGLDAGKLFLFGYELGKIGLDRVDQLLGVRPGVLLPVVGGPVGAGFPARHFADRGGEALVMFELLDVGQTDAAALLEELGVAGVLGAERLRLAEGLTSLGEIFLEGGIEREGGVAVGRTNLLPGFERMVEAVTGGADAFCGGAVREVEVLRADLGGEAFQGSVAGVVRGEP